MAGVQFRRATAHASLPITLSALTLAFTEVTRTQRVLASGNTTLPEVAAAVTEYRKLGAYGIANIAAGIFAAPMSVGIPARSLASVRCGGTTRMSNIFHAAFILGCIILGSQYIAHIPIPALAGVTSYIGICLLEWSTWRRLRRMRRVDAAAFLATAAAVLVVNAVLAVAIGCSFYLAKYLYLRLYKHVPDAEPAGVAVGSAQ